MERLMFRTEDGFLYEEADDVVILTHMYGEFRQVHDENTMTSFYPRGSEEEQTLFGRINEILRMVDSFKEKINK